MVGDLGIWERIGKSSGNLGRSQFLGIGLVELLYELRSILQIVYRLPGILLRCPFITLPLNKIYKLGSGPISSLAVQDLLYFILQVIPKENRDRGRFGSERERVREVRF